MIKNKIKMRIPVVTEVVILGDPELKCNQSVSAEQNLNRRIKAVEKAIGQDETISITRAHAIRAEKIA